MILLIVVVWFPYVMLLIGMISALIILMLTRMVDGFITLAIKIIDKIKKCDQETYKVEVI